MATVTALSDSSAWYALLSSSDTQHVAARRRFGRLVAAGRTVVATNHVISETYTLLRGRLGSRVALRFLEQVRADPFVRRVQVAEAWKGRPSCCWLSIMTRDSATSTRRPSSRCDTSDFRRLSPSTATSSSLASRLWVTSDRMSLPSNQTPTPTITRPDLERDQDVTPKALRPYKVVVLDWTTRVAQRKP